MLKWESQRKIQSVKCKIAVSLRDGVLQKMDLSRGKVNQCKIQSAKCKTVVSLRDDIFYFSHKGTKTRSFRRRLTLFFSHRGHREHRDLLGLVYLTNPAF